MARGQEKTSQLTGYGHGFDFPDNPPYHCITVSLQREI
jgi:hypothetical protein